jgi:hypothetical protein
MNAKGATPRPWRKHLAGSEGVYLFPDTGEKREDVKFIGVMNGRDLQTDQDNADLVLRTVNSHDALVALARAVSSYDGKYCEFDDIAELQQQASEAVRLAGEE